MSSNQFTSYTMIQMKVLILGIAAVFRYQLSYK